MKTYGIFGDSLLRGVMPDENGLYHSSEAIGLGEIAKQFGVTIHNYAMPTFTVVQGEQWMNSTLERQPVPDVAFLEFGGNDCDYRWKELAEGLCGEEEKHRTSLEDFEKTLRRMLLRLQDLQCKPVLVVSPKSYVQRYLEYLCEQGLEQTVAKYSITSQKLEKEYDQYVAAILGLADEYALIVMDLRTYFVDATPIGDYYTKDGLHPNERGYQLIGEGFRDFFLRHQME